MSQPLISVDMLNAPNLKWSDMKKETRITIIGLGNVGTALLNVFSANDFNVVSVFNRSEIDRKLIKRYPDIIFQKGLPKEGKELGKLIFLTVSDDAIPSLAKSLSDKLESFSGKEIVHCSGTHSSKVLDTLADRGALTASFHPMKAITTKTNSLENTWFDLEGDEKLLQKLEILAADLDAHTFRVEPEAKPLLHASAVVASNYLVVLADLVSKIAALADIPEDQALKAISPLMQNTLDNITDLGVSEALTGPIVRGDIKTIQQHLQSLQKAPDILSLYKRLGLEAVNIAISKQGSSASYEEIRKLLS